MDGKRIRVLLIERERLYDELITEILQENYDVEIERMETLPQPHQLKGAAFDVILTDPFEESINFEDFVSEVKTLYPRIPIVFITRNRDPEAIIKGFRMGITDYLLKPFQEEDFKRMFQRAIFALHSLQSPASEGIFQVCQQLNLCRSIDRFFYILALYIAKTLASKKAVVLFKHAQADKGIEILHTIGIPKTMETSFRHLLVNEEGCDFLIPDETVRLTSVENLPLVFQEVFGKTGQCLFVSLGDVRTGKGMLEFDVGERSHESISTQLPLIEELLSESKIIFSNLMAFLEAREIALKDDVTDLYNMRSFQYLVERELKAAEKHGYPVSVLFMDVDDFKKVNDTYGHLVGSKVLRELADILKYNLRKGELIFRFGGDEFVVVLPATDLEQAKEVGERIRSSIACHVFQSDEKKNIRITVSMGIAVYPDHTKCFQDLLEAADEAMYRGKRKTKNVVFVAEGPKKSKKE